MDCLDSTPPTAAWRLTPPRPARPKPALSACSGSRFGLTPARPAATAGTNTKYPPRVRVKSYARTHAAWRRMAHGGRRQPGSGTQWNTPDRSGCSLPALPALARYAQVARRIKLAVPVGRLVDLSRAATLRTAALPAGRGGACEGTRVRRVMRKEWLKMKWVSRTIKRQQGDASGGGVCVTSESPRRGRPWQD